MFRRIQKCFVEPTWPSAVDTDWIPLNSLSTCVRILRSWSLSPSHRRRATTVADWRRRRPDRRLLPKPPCRPRSPQRPSVWERDLCECSPLNLMQNLILPILDLMLLEYLLPAKCGCSSGPVIQQQSKRAPKRSLSNKSTTYENWCLRQNLTKTPPPTYRRHRGRSTCPGPSGFSPPPSCQSWSDPNLPLYAPTALWEENTTKSKKTEKNNKLNPKAPQRNWSKS